MAPPLPLSARLTAAGANNVDFIKIQAPRTVWNNKASGAATQKGGSQKRARSRSQLTTTLALAISPTPTVATLQAIVDLKSKAIS